MTNLTFSGMPTGFDMSDPAHYDYKSQTVLGPILLKNSTFSPRDITG